MTGDTKAGSAAVSSMIAAVKKTIARHDMIRPGDTVVAAVSGGPDSVCLLHLLHGLREELPMGLVVAHFDHGLRPAEDGHETRFVESLARSLDCAFDTARADPELRRTAACLEERARHARYRFLEEVRIRHAARRIALGHTRDDQAETVLMRLMRGSGPTGLAGIPPTRDGVIIRPLIDTSRQDVERYLDAAGLSFVTDSSNRETRHLRNRIRMELLPELARYQPRIVERLAQTADIMRMDDRFMEKTAQEWMETHTTGGASGDITCAVPSLRGLPDALRYRVIRRAIAAVGGSLRRIGARHLDAVMEAISGEKPQSAVDLPGSLVFRRNVRDRHHRPRPRRPHAPVPLRPRRPGEVPAPHPRIHGDRGGTRPVPPPGVGVVDTHRVSRPGSDLVSPRDQELPSGGPIRAAGHARAPQAQGFLHRQQDPCGRTLPHPCPDAP